MNDHLTPAAKPAGHPMDKVLQRIFKDPDVTLEGERVTGLVLETGPHDRHPAQRKP